MNVTSNTDLCQICTFPEQDYTEWKDTDGTYDPNYEMCFLRIFSDLLMFFICIFGLVGDGIVIWLLGFQIKRNPFTTYVLNLAVADSGVLIIVLLIDIQFFSYYFIETDLLTFAILFYLFSWMYCAGQLFLTAISTDRCVSVLFPIWHRCRCPPCMSTAVCALTWVLCFLLGGLAWIPLHASTTETENSFYLFTVLSLVCLLLMTVCSLTLFIKVCLKSRQQRRGKLLTAILFALFFFLILNSPVTVIFLLETFLTLHAFYYFDLLRFVLFCASLNSSVNPLIYFLVGRKRRGQSRESMKVILQRIFCEEEDPSNQLELRVRT